MIPTEQRFWSKVDKSGECWLWTGHCDEAGYGQFSLTPTQPVRAHRFSYELAYGPIPDGLFACHRCDNPPCVRPDHLFAGTAKDNTQDSIQKGRWAFGARNGSVVHPEKRLRGEANPHAKLTAEQVKEIRRQRGQKKIKELANEFGVSFGLIYQIQRGQGWKHI